MICTKNCFCCAFKDCLNDDFGPDDLMMVIEAEDCGGVLTEEERAALPEEILEAYRIEKKLIAKREAARRRKDRSRKKSRSYFPISRKE